MESYLITQIFSPIMATSGLGRGRFCYHTLVRKSFMTTFLDFFSNYSCFVSFFSSAEPFTIFKNLSDQLMPDRDAKELTPDSQQPLPSLCSCRLYDEKACYLRFHAGEITDCWLQCLDMSQEELDFCILSKLSCRMHLSQFTTKPQRKVRQKGCHTGQIFCPWI